MCGAYFWFLANSMGQCLFCIYITETSLGDTTEFFGGVQRDYALKYTWKWQILKVLGFLKTLGVAILSSRTYMNDVASDQLTVTITRFTSNITRIAFQKLIIYLTWLQEIRPIVLATYDSMQPTFQQLVHN